MDEIKTLLMKDPVRNVNLLNFMANNPIRRICREGESLLVKGRSDRDWVYISSRDAGELEILLKKHLAPLRDRNFAVIEPWMESSILKGAGTEWELRCEKYYLPSEAALPATAPSGAAGEIRKLSPASAGHIYRNYSYSDFLEVDYIEERIESGPAFAVFDEELPAAWVMTHDDDAIGMLHVLPEYRGRGYARALVSRISAEMRQAGRLPFMHIEADNRPSLSLAISCGYRLHSRISWFGIAPPNPSEDT